MNILEAKLKYIKTAERQMTCRDIIAVLQFLMYFNVFESTFFDDNKYSQINGNRKQVYERLENLNDAIYKKVNVCDYDFFAEHFSRRYSRTRMGNDMFCDLNLCYKISTEVREAIFNVVNYHSYSDKLIYYYLEICYKYRNNLFHGDKEIEGIGQYYNEFCCINNFMSKLMNDLTKVGFQQRF